MKEAILNNGVLTLSFSGSDFYKTLDFVRGLSGAMFNSDDKTWTIDDSVKNLTLLECNGFSVEILDKNTKRVVGYYTTKKGWISIKRNDFVDTIQELYTIAKEYAKEFLLQETDENIAILNSFGIFQA